MSEPALELVVPAPLLPLGRPFTRGQAAAVGVTRSRLGTLVREGRVQRLLRGVYADATAVPDQGFRAEAVALALRGEVVAAGRTAAWLHGAPVAPFAVTGAPPVPTQRLPARTVPARDVVEVRGVAVTTPLRTALDLAREDEEGVALAVTDHFLAAGVLRQVGLLAALASGRCDARVRELVAVADGRARGPAESVLRLQWLRSRLPTPTPGLVVPARSAAVRLALGVGEHRFGVLLPSGPDGAAASHDVAWLREAGWWLVVVPATRLLRAGPTTVRQHLEREYHQALLRDVG